MHYPFKLQCLKDIGGPFMQLIIPLHYIFNYYCFVLTALSINNEVQ